MTGLYYHHFLDSCRPDFSPWSTIVTRVWFSRSCCAILLYFSVRFQLGTADSLRLLTSSSYKGHKVVSLDTNGYGYGYGYGY